MTQIKAHHCIIATSTTMKNCCLLTWTFASTFEGALRLQASKKLFHLRLSEKVFPPRWCFCASVCQNRFEGSLCVGEWEVRKLEKSSRKNFSFSESLVLCVTCRRWWVVACLLQRKFFTAETCLKIIYREGSKGTQSDTQGSIPRANFNLALIKNMRRKRRKNSRDGGN